MTVTGGKLKELDGMLMGVENELLHRKVDRQEITIDGALDTINKAAEAGAIDLGDCVADGGGEADSGGTQGDEAETEAGGEEDSDADTSTDPDASAGDDEEE